MFTMLKHYGVKLPFSEYMYYATGGYPRIVSVKVYTRTT